MQIQNTKHMHTFLNTALLMMSLWLKVSLLEVICIESTVPFPSTVDSAPVAPSSETQVADSSPAVTCLSSRQVQGHVLSANISYHIK